MLYNIKLSNDQKASIDRLCERAAPQFRKALQDALALRERTSSAPADEGRDRDLAQATVDAIARVIMLKARIDSEILAVLTPEQRKAWPSRRV